MQVALRVAMTIGTVLSINELNEEHIGAEVVLRTKTTHVLLTDFQNPSCLCHLPADVVLDGPG